jgi:hypothetical protein
MMQKLFFALCVIMLVFTAWGCSPADDTTKIDPTVAKQQPGADTPPAPPNGVTEAQLKKAKNGD